MDMEEAGERWIVLNLSDISEYFLPIASCHLYIVCSDAHFHMILKYN